MTISKAAFANLESEDLEALYAELAIAEAGTDPEIARALEGVASVRAMLAGEGAAAAGLTNPIGWLARKGKAIFNRYWPQVKSAVCSAYEEHGEEWIEKAADAIAKLLSLPGAIIAIILKIAIKLGMGLLCGADAPAQPA